MDKSEITKEQSEVPTVLIRVDGGDVIGYGHLMRSKAIAEGFREKSINVIFYSRIIDGSAERILSPAKFSFVLIPEISENQNEADWVIEDYSTKYKSYPLLVITDGYHFNSKDWEIYTSHSKLMVTDAFGGRDYSSADLVYNAYTDAEELDYSSVLKQNGLLAGPSYALIRDDVLKARQEQQPVQKVKTILINGGGVDEHDVVGNVAKGLKHVSNELWPERAYFITGRKYPFYDQLQLHLIDLPFSVNLVEPHNWIDLLNSVDLAIIAGGSTQYEAAYLGTPYVSFIVEENQLGLTRTMSELGITPFVGWLREKNPAEIGRIYESIIADVLSLNQRAKKGMQLIDGKGVDRVLTRCLNLLKDQNG